MNEIRDLIVGIDFGKEYSQICYYDRKGDEARSLSMKAGGNQYEALYSVLETGAERLLRRTGSRLLCPGKGRGHDR